MEFDQTSPFEHNQLNTNYAEYCRQDAIEKSNKIAELLVEQAVKKD